MLPPQLKGAEALPIDEIYAMFPNLRERAGSPGTRLSGGEQQMLAVARILRTGSRLLLMDEISEGLAPVIVQKLGDVIRTSRRKVLPWCWSSRTSALQLRWQIGSTSWRAAGSSNSSNSRSSVPKWGCSTSF